MNEESKKTWDELQKSFAEIEKIFAECKEMTEGKGLFAPTIFSPSAVRPL